MFKPRYIKDFQENHEKLDFRLLDSQTVKQYISIGLSYSIYGILLDQPWETNKLAF